MLLNALALQKPLTSVPDPFKKYKSFGEHNNEMLKKFLNDEKHTLWKTDNI